MSYPQGYPVIDLMLNFPVHDTGSWYASMRPLFMDHESRDVFAMPAQYMFKNIPESRPDDDPVLTTLALMDKYNIRQAMLGVDDDNVLVKAALKKFPQRFFCSYLANPNNGMDEVRKIRRLHAESGIKAVTAFPSGICPQVSLADKKWYPIFVTCIDLGIPFCPCVGVPGPRLPMEPQKVEHLDEICWFFPELKIVMRHGGEPWVDLACKLMLKYPNLYYMTSAFAPRHYPQAIIDVANSRGADKILYAGYFPMGLSLDRIFSELPSVPFKDDVWPRFLSGNAARVFGLAT